MRAPCRSCPKSRSHAGALRQPFTARACSRCVWASPCAGRWEWSPLYFKEITWRGSNAFGVEEVEGVRKHGIEHYLDLVVDGRIDLTGLLTHTFGLSEWQQAFYTIAEQEHTGAIKVAIDPSR